MTEPVCPENVKGSDAELLACPFCGELPSRAYRDGSAVGSYFLVSCRNCGARTESKSSAQLAEFLWNKRAAVPSVGEEQKEWESVIETIGHYSGIRKTDGSYVLWGLTEAQANRICDAHNQSLSALRSQKEYWIREYQQVKDANENLVETIANLRGKIAQADKLQKLTFDNQVRWAEKADLLSAQLATTREAIKESIDDLWIDHGAYNKRDFEPTIKRLRAALSALTPKTEFPSEQVTSTTERT